MVSEAHPTKRLRFVFGWIVNNSHVTYWRAYFSLEDCQPSSLVFCFHTAFNVVLINELDALQLILFGATRPFELNSTIRVVGPCCILSTIAVGAVTCVSVKEVEQFDEGAVRHLFACFMQLFSFDLDVVILIVFIVSVVCLVL